MRRLDPSDVLVWNGIPVTTVARMCVDLTATEAAMARANGRRNRHVLERALELNASGSAGTRSGKEDAFRKAQSNEPLVNVKVDGIEVDFHRPGDEHFTGEGWRVTRVKA